VVAPSRPERTDADNAVDIQHQGRQYHALMICFVDFTRKKRHRETLNYQKMLALFVAQHA
jgi:hypothetical protein